MGFSEHFHLMARYNQRMNQQVYAASAVLSPDILAKDLGAYFHSIIGTLNHLLIVDLLWLHRFSHHRDSYDSLKRISRYPEPGALDGILFDKLAELQAVREELDALIQFWVDNEVESADLSKLFTYTNRKGIGSTRRFGELLGHFFNHQTHHRGQLSTMLMQQGVDVGITDFLIDIPDKS